jgi:hypothetical protein
MQNLNIYGFTLSSQISLQEIHISVEISAQPDQDTGTVVMPASVQKPRMSRSTGYQVLLQRQELS